MRNALLNEARDIPVFQAELVRLVSAESQGVGVFFGLMDGSKEVPLPSWVKSHLDRHPGLYKKLELSELVGISHNEDHPTPRPAGSARSNIRLIPIVNETVLYGAIGLAGVAEHERWRIPSVRNLRCGRKARRTSFCEQGRRRLDVPIHFASRHL